MVDQWQYTWGKVTRNGYVVLEGTDVEVSFDKLGEVGWELLSPSGTMAYFKRRLDKAVLVQGNVVVTKGKGPAGGGRSTQRGPS